MSEEEYQRLKVARVDTFKKAFKDMIATNDDAYLKLSGKTSRERTRLYTKEDIR